MASVIEETHVNSAPLPSRRARALRSASKMLLRSSSSLMAKRTALRGSPPAPPKTEGSKGIYVG